MTDPQNLMDLRSKETKLGSNKSNYNSYCHSYHACLIQNGKLLYVNLLKTTQ